MIAERHLFGPTSAGELPLSPVGLIGRDARPDAAMLVLAALGHALAHVG